jgi:serine/threonine-protein kinase RsbW
MILLCHQFEPNPTSQYVCLWAPVRLSLNRKITNHSIINSSPQGATLSTPPTRSKLTIDFITLPVLPISRVFLGVGCRKRMTAQAKRMEVTLESMMDSVDLAEDITVRVAEAAGFDEEDRHRIGMSVREGMINAVTYGNHQNRDKKVFLTIELENGRMAIRILDQGDGFTLSDVPDPLAEENLLKSSGRGILLMKAFMDEFNVVCGRTGGAELILVKKLPVAN